MLSATLRFFLAAFLVCSACDSLPGAQTNHLEKRWLFFWRDMNDPAEVDAMISHFPEARAAGYNGVVFSHDIAPSKASELKNAARTNGLDLIAVVMGGSRDRNNTEGVLVSNALFVVRDGRATLEQDNPTRILNGDFEDANGDHFRGWAMQDDEGVTTFADHAVTHGGKTSLRMEDISKNEHNHCRLMQPIKLQPHRQYRISFWLKTENLTPADAEVKVLAQDADRAISFETFHVEAAQDWRHTEIVFNSFGYTNGLLYLGAWSGKSGKMWWDDLQIEEIGLVNVLRRPGCPVTVRGENGTVFEEGRDIAPIADPLLNPWQPYHEPPPIRIPAGSRIADGTHLRVSYYHPIIVYEDRVNYCLSEPGIFAEWEDEIKKTDDLLHPAAFFLSHDEIRVMNQCALCQSKNMTPGELLASNVRQAAAIIRKIRPDAEIWIWSDMFDPMHNAVDNYYAVNGSLADSWKGLDKDIGIVNWNGGLKGKNCQFFANLGLRQILSGYYDSDDDGSGIAECLANARNISGTSGAMYTTWENKYGAMKVWADKAWGNH